MLFIRKGLSSSLFTSSIALLIPHYFIYRIRQRRRSVYLFQIQILRTLGLHMENNFLFVLQKGLKIDPQTPEQWLNHRKRAKPLKPLCHRYAGGQHGTYGVAGIYCSSVPFYVKLSRCFKQEFQVTSCFPRLTKYLARSLLIAWQSENPILHREVWKFATSVLHYFGKMDLWSGNLNVSRQ